MAEGTRFRLAALRRVMDVSGDEIGGTIKPSDLVWKIQTLWTIQTCSQIGFTGISLRHIVEGKDFGTAAFRQHR
jgi:hypothetical protein